MAGTRGPAEPGPGSAGLYRPLSRAEIARAVPPGSRRFRTQRQALRAFLRDPELADVRRSDFRGHLTEIWRYLVRWAWQDGCTSMPVRSRLCEDLGVSESTWKRCRRWLEDRGWLGTVRAGFTPALRPMALADPDAPNEAAIYVLCSPRKTAPRQPASHSQTLTGPLMRSPMVTDPSHGVREKPVKVKTGKAAADAATHYRRHVAVVRQGPLRKRSSEWVAWAIRPFLHAGYTPADLAHAISHHPEHGRYRLPVDDVTNPAAWLGWRLSRWMTDPDTCFAHFRDRGRWPDQLQVLRPPSARQWDGTVPVGQQYLAASRRKAAAAAAVDLRSRVAGLRQQLAGKSAGFRKASIRDRPRGGQRDHSRGNPPGEAHDLDD